MLKQKDTQIEIEFHFTSSFYSLLTLVPFFQPPKFFFPCILKYFTCEHHFFQFFLLLLYPPEMKCFLFDLIDENKKQNQQQQMCQDFCKQQSVTGTFNWTFITNLNKVWKVKSLKNKNAYELSDKIAIYFAFRFLCPSKFGPFVYPSLGGSSDLCSSISFLNTEKSKLPLVE